MLKLLVSIALLTFSLGLGCKSDSEAVGQSTTDPAHAPATGDGSQTKSTVDPPPAPTTPLPDGALLLENAVKAAGGHGSLAQIKSFYKEGRVSLTGQNIGGDVRSWWKDGDFYTENVIVGVGQAEGGKLGDAVWTRDPINGLRRIDGVEAEQALWNGTLSLAADWPRFFKTVRTVAERSKNGRKIYDVELTSEAGTKLTLSLDAESGLQVGQSFRQASPMGDMPVKVELEDFREVNGVMVPFREVMDASLATIVQEFTKIEVNVEVDTSKFAMPTGGAEVVPVPLAPAPVAPAGGPAGDRPTR